MPRTKQVTELFIKERVRLPFGGLSNHVVLADHGLEGVLDVSLDSYVLTEKNGDEHIFSRADVAWATFRKPRPVATPMPPPEGDGL